MPNNSRNIITNHIEDLEEIKALPDLMESLRKQRKIKSIQNIDNQLGINTLPNCVTNHGKRRVAHSVEKGTPANDHTLPDPVTNRGKQSVARSRETNNFANNLDQQKARNETISTNTRQTLANDSDIYLVEQVKKHRHRDRKLEFLIKWLGYSNRQNTWEPEDHLSHALVEEYFQQSPLEKLTPTNKVFMTKILTKGPPVTWRYYIPRTLVL